MDEPIQRSGTTPMNPTPSVLISGASFAGLAAAWWMNKLGYSVCFGEESSFLVFLQCYFSLTIVPKLLIEENTSQMLNVAGKAIMLNAYDGKTDKHGTSVWVFLPVHTLYETAPTAREV